MGTVPPDAEELLAAELREAGLPVDMAAIRAWVEKERVTDLRIEALHHDLRAPTIESWIQRMFHRHWLHHRQWQWDIELPWGATPLRGERLKCECGTWFRP